jgi:hypothetical protein
VGPYDFHRDFNCFLATVAGFRDPNANGDVPRKVAICEAFHHRTRIAVKVWLFVVYPCHVVLKRAAATLYLSRSGISERGEEI